MCGLVGFLGGIVGAASNKSLLRRMAVHLFIADRMMRGYGAIVSAILALDIDAYLSTAKCL